MTYYFTGFVRSPGGLLKMIQILIGLVLMLILMGGHYDVSTGLYRLRIDAFLMTMTVFTFVLTSALLLMCTIMGSTELPNSVLYRINYLLATITYFPFTVGFIFEEYMHGDIKQTIAGGVLSITNSLIYMFNLCVSYELRCLKSRRRERKPKGGRHKHRGRKSKGKKGGMSEIDVLMGRDRAAGATAGLTGHIRNERDLLATGDVETFHRLQQIQQMNRLLENDPIMFHQQTMLGAQQAYAQEQQQYMAQAGGGSPAAIAAGLHSGGAPMADEFGRRPRDDRLARRVVHEVYRGEFLPGEEYLMQPAVGKEFIIPIQVEGRKTPTTSASTSPSEKSESDSPKKSPKKKGKKDSKHKKKKSKKGSKRGSKHKKKRSKKGSKKKHKKKKKSKGKKRKKKK
ncbi:uncharacterized protein LOC119403091 isoform X1 [Rhipicephalus sanguineus]|uniref:uncharacterized protein LOC119403091 isoform X1 n=1 Tax=Rhipicephalus sanguineus TaxID=34632 RepID=UPI001894A8F5|nr:uncharacterized protein LOC119403091 isoform X1 [Rhipicephalus sanguineus]